MMREAANRRNSTIPCKRLQTQAKGLGQRLLYFFDCYTLARFQRVCLLAAQNFFAQQPRQTVPTVRPIEDDYNRMHAGLC